ncbi:hypothetical protein EMCRGX_G018689 [Ephydatia muelleri]
MNIALSALTSLPANTVNNFTDTISFQITTTDLNQIKLDCLSYPITATFNSGITYDSSNNLLVGAPGSNPLPVTTIPDNTSPQVQFISLDLNVGSLVVTLNEPFTPMSVQPALVTITNNITNPTAYYALSSAIPISTDPFNLSLNFSGDLLNALVTLVADASGLPSPIRITPCVSYDRFVKDLSSISVIPVPVFQPNITIPYTTPPQLSSFTLDMNNALLTMSFTAPMLLSTLKTAGITIQGAAYDTSMYTLTSNSTGMQSSPLVIMVTLSDQDLNAIKSIPTVAKHQADTFLAIASNTIKDAFGNAVSPIVNGFALLATAYVQDTAPPALLSFSFGPLNGRVSLSLTFSEAVNASSVNVNDLILSSMQDATSSSAVLYNLTSSVPLPLNSKVITIPLSDNGPQSDLFTIINSKAPLGQPSTITYLYFDERALSDMQGNMVVAILSTMARPSTNIVTDLTPPSLLNFTLDMNSGIVSLTFSKPILLQSFDLTKLTLQESVSGGPSVTLTGGSAISISNTTFLVNLTSTDLNNIKTLQPIMTASTTYASLTYGLAADLAAQLYWTWNSYPLTFSEAVTILQSNINLFVLQSTFSGGSNFVSFRFDPTLTVLSYSSSLVTFTMATSDKLSLQAMTRIATSINNTYISVTAAAAQDSFGNTIVPILPGAPLKASAVILDNLPPTVMQYNIDMNLGTLVLYADGTVQAVFSPASYTLQNAATAPTATFTLLTSTLTRFISFTTFTIGISTSDLNVLKAKGICTSNTSCFLTYTAGALVNSKGIRSNNLTVGIPPAVFIRDTTSPTLINFSQFNAATSILMLNFSEPVIASSFVAQGVTLQSLFSGTTDLSIYTLMGGSTLSTGNVLLLTVSLSSIDTNVVKLNPYICTTRGNCYVTLNSSTITDVAGNQLTAQTIGLLVDSYIYDVISPVLVNFTVDMDGGNGTLFFSKPVSATGFLVSAITFLGKPGATNTYRLTSSTASASSGQVITVFFSMYDLNNIKNSAFAKSIVDTYLAIDSSATTDLSLKRNSLMPITIFNPLQASKYIKDQTPPVVQAIVLDLNSGLLLLSFNEPVNTTTINFSNIAVTLLPGSSTVALTGGSVASIVSGSAFTVTVSLTPQDLLQLKLSTTMVAITGATISIGANMVTDIANNANFSIVLTNASVIPDTASPALLSFTLDITTSTLYLTFSDVVAPTYPNLPFDPTGITLQASKFRGSNDYFTLTSQSQTNSPAGYIIVINLNNDLVSIINNPYFGSSVSNTYITIQAGTIQSIFGQNTEAIINGKALQASLVILRNITTILTSFPLFDLNLGRLTLSFSYYIDVTSVSFSQFTLQSAPLAVPQTMYTLTSSSMATVTGTNLTILLSNFDLSGIQTIPGLAMSRTTTYISFTSTAIRDISHNLVAPVLNGNATQAAVFVPDTTAPFVTSFILDLNTGSLMLTFSKLVNIPALAASQIRLQNRQNVNLGITQSVQLTGSLLQSTLISNVASLWLPVPVLQTFSTSFGTLQSNTYLTLTALTVSDLSSNPVIPILSTDALPPSAPIKADTSPPALVAFDLNLGTSTLSLVWSKPVNASTLSTTQITIQGSITAFTANSTYRLTGSQALSPSSAVLNVTLSILDGIFLRMATAFATNRNNTFITIGSGAVLDLSQHASVAIANGMAQQVRIFTPDYLPPKVASFTLDFNIGMLSITFDEVVTSLNPRAIQLQDNLVSPTSSYTLQYSSLNSIIQNTATVNLGLLDIDNLEIASLTNITYIALLNASTSDIFNNTVTVKTVQAPIGIIIPDTVAPALLSFILSLTTEQLYLNFSKVIRISDLYLPSLTIQSSSYMPIPSYSLGQSTAILPNGRNITINLAGPNAVSIKADGSLGTNTSNTFLSFDALFARDLFGNSIAPISSSTAKQALYVIPDTSQPRLLQFIANLSANTITLQFSEAVNVAASISISLTAIDALFVQQQALLGNFFSLVNNTFLSMTQQTINDTSRNPVVGIPASMPYPAYMVIPDIVGPSVVAWTLDMNNGNMTIHFDKPVYASSFNASGITLVGANTSFYYTLTSSAMALSAYYYTNVIIILSTTDRDGISSKPICNSTSDCYLSHSTGIVFDLFNNPAVVRPPAIAIRVSQLGVDFNQPAYTEYLLFDRNTGVVQLQFSETLYGASVQLSQLTFQTYYNPGAVPNYTLSASSSVLSSSSLILTIQLSKQDLNNLKKTTGLCSDRASCVAVFGTKFATDFAGNSIKAFTLTSTDLRIYPALFIPDSTPSTIIQFMLYPETGTIAVIFDEPVSSVIVFDIALQNAFNATVTYQLTTPKSAKPLF